MVSREQSDEKLLSSVGNLAYAQGFTGAFKKNWLAGKSTLCDRETQSRHSTAKYIATAVCG